jgi:hypothetical protein
MLAESIASNIANVGYNRVMWKEGLNSSQRLNSLSLIISYLDFLNGMNSECMLQGKMSNDEMMMRSMTIAEYYRRGGEYIPFTGMLRCAVESFPQSDVSGVLQIPGWVVVNPEGSFRIDGNASGWTIRQDTIPAANISWNHQDEGLFRSKIQSLNEKRAVFALNRPLDITYHHTVELKAVVSQNCRISVKAIVDDQNLQYLRYDGIGNEVKLPFVLQGNHLENIYIRLDYLGTTVPAECEMTMKSITFYLD